MTDRQTESLRDREAEIFREKERETERPRDGEPARQRQRDKLAHTDIRTSTHTHRPIYVYIYICFDVLRFLVLGIYLVICVFIGDRCVHMYTHMGAVLKPLSVSLYKPQIDYIKVCKTLARERYAKAARKRCERELPN